MLVDKLGLRRRGSKMKIIFIKNNITGDYYLSCWEMKTLVAFVGGTIANENVLCRPVRELVVIVRLKQRVLRCIQKALRIVWDWNNMK